MTTLNQIYDNKGLLIYKGDFRYNKNNKTYSKEKFEVWENKDTHSTTFISNLLTKIEKREAIAIDVIYQIDGDKNPSYIQIKRDINGNISDEIFHIDKIKNILTYKFIKDKSEKKVIFPYGSNVHIATPASAPSLLFIKPQKNGSKCFQTNIKSNNDLVFREEPKRSTFILEKSKYEGKSFYIGKKSYPTELYKIYDRPENVDLNNIDYKDRPHLDIQLSQLSNIPFKIKSTDNYEIEMISFINYYAKEKLDLSF